MNVDRHKKVKVTGYSPFEQLHEPSLAQFVPPGKNMTDKRCENCIYYSRIDSGYGFCRRYPPTRNNKNKKNRVEYPVVEWNRKSCGEFVSKKEV